VGGDVGALLEWVRPCPSRTACVRAPPDAGLRTALEAPRRAHAVPRGRMQQCATCANARATGHAGRGGACRARARRNYIPRVCVASRSSRPSSNSCSAILPSSPCIARVVQPHVQRHRVYTHGIHRRSSRVFGPSADHVRARRLEICAMSAVCSVELAHTSALLQCPSGTGCAYPLPADARRGPRARARGICGSLSCALEIQCPLGRTYAFR
jgi:hypothetical protein